MLAGLLAWSVCFVGLALSVVHITGGKASTMSLPLAISCGLFAVVPELIGRVTGNLTTGILFLAGAGWLVVWRRGVVLPSFKLGVRPGIAAAAMVILLAAVMATTSLWDRAGHAMFVGALARGVIPLQYPVFPGENLVYHVGFDVFAAGLVEVGKLRLGSAIEASQWLTAGLAMLALKEAMPTSRFVWLLPLFAHGPLAVCTGALPLTDICTTALPFADPFSAVPPPPSNMLQPPQGFGIALAFSYAAGAIRFRPGWLATALLFWTLSQANLVVFMLFGFGLAASCAVSLARSRDTSALISLSAMAIAFGAWLVVGTFRPGASAHLAAGGFFGEHALLGLVVFMAVPIAGTAVALIRLGRVGAGREVETAVAFACSAGLLIVLSVHYENSWDIVKFGSVAAFMGCFAFARWLEGVERIAVVVAICVLSSITSVGWMVRLSVLNEPRIDSPGEEDLGERFVAHFGAVVPGNECVLTPGTRISHAGVLTVGSDPAVAATMVIDRAYHERKAEEFRDFIRLGTLSSAVRVGCPFIFMPNAWVPAPDLSESIEPVGQMYVLKEVWTLYQFRGSPGAK